MQSHNKEEISKEKRSSKKIRKDEKELERKQKTEEQKLAEEDLRFGYPSCRHVEDSTGVSHPECKEENLETLGKTKK